MNAISTRARRLAGLALFGLTLAAAGSAAAWEPPVYAGPVFWHSTQPYVTPQQGQSPERQAQDWHACEQWATVQAFANGVPLHAARFSPDYRQAFSACLSALGYRVGFGIER